MTAPGLGQYRVTMEYMAGTSVLYIREIVFLPRISKNSAYADILLYSLGGDAFYNRPRTQVPEYALGELQFNTEEFFQSHSEGHQPWREDPLSVAENLCWNLLGDRMLSLLMPEGFPESYRRVWNRLETTAGLAIDTLDYSIEMGYTNVVEMTVPDLGKYMFTSENRGDFESVYTKTITFTPSRQG
jgi:hypothetical protein